MSKLVPVLWNKGTPAKRRRVSGYKEQEKALRHAIYISNFVGIQQFGRDPKYDNHKSKPKDIE